MIKKTGNSILKMVKIGRGQATPLQSTNSYTHTFRNRTTFQIYQNYKIPIKNKFDFGKFKCYNFIVKKN